jgi:hypothetical protein
MTLWVNPRLTLGVIGRGNSASPDQLTLSVQPRYALTDQLTLVPTLAFSLPLESSGSWLVPCGAGLHYGMNRQLDLGGDFTFGTLVPHGGLGVFDVRTLRLYLTARL